MYLKTAGKIGYDNVTEAQLREAFRDDKGRGEFIILSHEKDGKHFLQAANSGEGDDPFIIEYQEGDRKHHFYTKGEYPKAQIEQAFLSYLNGDERWRTDFPWMQEKSLWQVLVGWFKNGSH